MLENENAEGSEEIEEVDLNQYDQNMPLVRLMKSQNRKIASMEKMLADKQRQEKEADMTEKIRNNDTDTIGKILRERGQLPFQGK